MRRKVRIGGEAVEPAEGDIVETETGAYSILVDGKAWEAWVSGAEIVVSGRRLEFEIDDPRAWKRTGGSGGGQGRALITAPMPGKVVRVLATAGERVEAGQGIVVVEAMKMQNEMKAPRAGRVIAIAVRENDSVNAGTVLATIE